MLKRRKSGAIQTAQSKPQEAMYAHVNKRIKRKHKKKSSIK
jgi:hypothetical protein